MFPQTQSVCRCLEAYLEAVKTGLTESMSDFQVVELKDEAGHPGHKKWLLKDTETKCDYCRALNNVLLISHFDSHMLPHLAGLLHDITLGIETDLMATAREAA